MAQIQVHDAGCERLIEADAPVDRIAAGFTFAEGPVWHGRERVLICSDIP
jgi:sugar lactone lactonase YvrE